MNTQVDTWDAVQKVEEKDTRGPPSDNTVRASRESKENGNGRDKQRDAEQDVQRTERPNEDYFTKEEIEKMVDRHWANTQVKQALIDGLKLREVSNGKAAAIYCMIETDEKRMDMIQYILENKKGTEDEFLNEARRIAAK